MAVDKAEVVVNRQTALGSIDILARHFAAAYPDAFLAEGAAGAVDAVVSIVEGDDGACYSLCTRSGITLVFCLSLCYLLSAACLAAVGRLRVTLV